MKTKCFVYLRVSGRGQIDKDGFPRQREAVNQYAKRNKIQIEREFVEKGVSGTTDTPDRDALTDLFIALKSNGVRLVLVEQASRLARDLMISEILLGEFRKIGVKVIAVDSSTDLTVEDNDPTKKLIRQVLGAVSEFEKSCLVQKLRVSRMRMRKTEGRCEGAKPYGFTDSEKVILARIQDLKKSGVTIAAIAEQLNADGIKPRIATRAGQESKWHPTTIQRILARL